MTMRERAAITTPWAFVLLYVFIAIWACGCAAPTQHGDSTRATGQAIDRTIHSFNELAELFPQLSKYVNDNGKALIAVGQRMVVDGKGAGVLAAIELAKVRKDVDDAHEQTRLAIERAERAESTVGYRVEAWVKALSWIALALTIITVIGIGVVLVWFPGAPIIGGLAQQALHALPVMQAVVWPLKVIKWAWCTFRQLRSDAPVAM